MAKENAKYEIKEGMPVPPPYLGKRIQRYPLNELKVGQYFEVPYTERQHLRSKVWAQNKRERKRGTGKEFIARIWVADDGTDHIGCWRTK